MPLRYKFLLAGLKSQSGNHAWKIGEWYKIDGLLEICSVGFHCSKLPLDAFDYVPGEVIARVECRGESIEQEDKDCWSEMRVKHAWNWTKEDSVAMAIFAAELVIANFELVYPNDDRPRKAIEAAKAYLAAAGAKKQSAARAANSAADSAYSAANSAAYSAYSAANSAANSAAKSAAKSAADSAYSAAYSAANSAAYSAYSAARAARAADIAADIKKKVNAWMIQRIKTLNPIE